MDYRICEANSTEILQREVSQAIGEGWRPAGGIAVAIVAPMGMIGMTPFFYQAMVREVPRMQAPGGRARHLVPNPPVRPMPPELGRAVAPRPPRPPRRPEEG